MKVLIWVGNPVNVYGQEHRRELARVWVGSQNKVHVEALAPEFENFAREVQADIDNRIADPRAGFYRFTGNSWKTKDGTRKSVTRQEIAEPGDDNFLEVLRSDWRLNGGVKGRNIAGYKIRDGASRIIEE